MPITHPKHENDFKLIFDNEIFHISKCLFGLYSKVFRQHPSFVFHQSLDMSEKSISKDIFKEFIKACQGHFFDLNFNNCFGLLKLCEKWEVDVIKDEIINFIANIDDSSSKLLKLRFYLLEDDSINKIELLKQESYKNEKNDKKGVKKNDKSQEINNIEEWISKHINSYLNDPLLASLPISSLFRIISKSFSHLKLHCKKNENKNNDLPKSADSLSDDNEYDIIDKHLFLNFLESVSNHHKEASRVLIKLIDDYGEFTPFEFKKLKEIANPFTEYHMSEDTTAFFNNFIHQNEEIDEFQNKISSTKKEGEQIIKKIHGEVKTLRHSMRKNAKNSPSQSKSFSNLSSMTESSKNSPVLSNSTSNLELASKTDNIQSESDASEQSSILTTPQNSPNKQKNHILHPSIPVPQSKQEQSSPNGNLPKSNLEILEYLDQLLAQFNHIKSLNLDVNKSVQNYKDKLTEFSQRYLQISNQLTEEQSKARERAKEIEKSKPQKNSLSQIEQAEPKPKSLSFGSKTSEKNSSKSSKYSFSSKGKSKDKSGSKNIIVVNFNNHKKADNSINNDDDHQNDFNTTSVPKANFQTNMHSNKNQSHSEKEPDAAVRVSFSDKSSSKHSVRVGKTAPSSSQSVVSAQSITVHNNNNQGLITVLPNQDLNSFNGLIYQLRCLNSSRDLNGNLAVRASSTKMAIAQPENVLISNSIWYTENKENQWILFDFISRKIKITNYRIKTIPYQANSFHMKNWVVEGNDENGDDNDDSWILLDKRENNSQLNNTSAVATFNTSFENDKFFRFVRIRMIGVNHTNTNVLAFSQIDFFGTMKISSDL